MTTTGRAPRPSSTVSSVAALAMRRGAGMMPDFLLSVQLSAAFLQLSAAICSFLQPMGDPPLHKFPLFVPCLNRFPDRF